MNLDGPILTEWEREALARIEKYDTIKYSREEGLEQGIEQGLEQGLKQGNYQAKIEIAKKMLEKKYWH